MSRWLNTLSPLSSMLRQIKKVKRHPDTQHSTWSTVGALNKLEERVKCKQNDRLCLRLPCVFLFERWSIFYYFSNRTLEFWKQFKSMHSWDLNVFSSDPSYILKHFGGMSVLVVINPSSLFKGWKKPTVCSSNSPDWCLAKTVSRLNL